MRTLEGKVAVITGASRGLGLAIALAFTREGAAVVLAGRSENDLSEAMKLLQEQGRHTSWKQTDVGNLEEVRQLAEHTVLTFGPIRTERDRPDPIFMIA